jgi:hypothetical protein
LVSHNQNHKLSNDGNIKPEKVNDCSEINCFNNLGGYQPQKIEPFGGQNEQPIGGGGLKSERNNLLSLQQPFS